MKFLCLLLGLMAMLTANAQLKMRTDKPTPQVKDPLYAFFNKNNFEYALVTYPLSTGLPKRKATRASLNKKVNGTWPLSPALASLKNQPEFISDRRH